MARRKSKTRKAKKLLTPRQRSLRMKKMGAARRKNNGAVAVLNPNLPGALPDEQVVRDQVLADAREAVSVDRREKYGNMVENFNLIVGLQQTFWDVYNANHEGEGRNTAYGHAVNMIFVKLAREATGKKSMRDNLVDIAGYSALAHEVAG